MYIFIYTYIYIYIYLVVIRPTACTFDNEGDLLIADTWNQRIRKITDMYAGCHHHADLNTEAEIAEYIARVNDVSDALKGPYAS